MRAETNKKTKSLIWDILQFLFIKRYFYVELTNEVPNVKIPSTTNLFSSISIGFQIFYRICLIYVTNHFINETIDSVNKATAFYNLLAWGVG